MPVLETPRLILREWSMADADDMYDYASNPKVGPMAGWKPHESREESAKIVKDFIERTSAGEELEFAMVLKSINRVIGSIGLSPDRKRHNPHAVMLGYAMGEPYWGRGLMPEGARRIVQYAFEERDADIVTVWHFSSNPQSRRVIEKLGFRLDGVLRQARIADNGMPLDDWCYSMTKDEFSLHEYPDFGM